MDTNINEEIIEQYEQTNDDNQVINDNQSEDNEDNEDYLNNNIYQPFKIICFYKINNDSDKKEVCSICLSDDEPMKIIETPCSHTFHEECLKQWLEKQKNCPTCRTSFEKEYYNDDYEELKNILVLDKNYNNIISLNLSYDKLSYNCDGCNERIYSEEYDCINRYHKKKSNYDLCENCFGKIPENEKKKYIVFNNESKFLFNLSLPKYLEELTLSYKFKIENHYLKLKNLCLENIEIIESKLEIKQLQAYNLEFINCDFSKIKNISIVGDINMCVNSFNNLLSNFEKPDDYFRIELDKIYELEDNKKKKLNLLKLSPSSLENISKIGKFDNIQSLTINSKTLITGIKQLDLYTSKIREITIENIIFDEFIKLPKDIVMINLKRITRKQIDVLDLSENKRIMGLELLKIPIKKIIFSNKMEAQEENDDYSTLNDTRTIIINHCGLEEIVNLPPLITDLNLSHNNLGDDSINFIEPYYNWMLVNLSCNKISNIDFLPKSTSYLYLNYNKLEELDISKLTNISNLECSNNKIKKLKLNKKVTYLDLSNNLIEDFEIKKSYADIILYNNNIKKIKISNTQISINKLNISNNKLEELDLKNVFIDIINCSKNKINKFTNYNFNSLNISNNPIDNIKFNKDSYFYVNINKTKIEKITISDKIDTNIKFFKLKCDEKKIKNKIIKWKFNKKSDTTKLDDILINEKNVTIRMLNY